MPSSSLTAERGESGLAQSRRRSVASSYPVGIGDGAEIGVVHHDLDVARRRFSALAADRDEQRGDAGPCEHEQDESPGGHVAAASLGKTSRPAERALLPSRSRLPYYRVWATSFLRTCRAPTVAVSSDVPLV